MESFSGEEEREIYALFGAAYFQSESLHRGLCLLYTNFGFEKKEHIIGLRTEERMRYAFTLTFGKIIDELKEEWVPGLLGKLIEAKEKRNYLAHHFWFEKVHLFYSRDGCQKLAEELNQAGLFFHNLDEEVEKIVSAKMMEFGVSQEIVNNELKKILKGEDDDLKFLKGRGKIEKVENIVKAWDAQAGITGLTSLILENEKGTFFQLSDIGLCFSKQTKVMEDWKESRIQKYLPSVMIARPKVRGPWDYDLKLKNKLILSVGFDEPNRRYTLKIKEIPD